MRRKTIAKLEEHFALYPFLRAEGASLNEIEVAAQTINLPFPDDFREFLHLYAGAIVGSFPIYGLRPVEAMGNRWNIIEVNQHFRQQQWQAVEKWLIISEDHSGNPIGITSDGTVYLSDHDYGAVSLVAKSFETFILSCMEIPREQRVRVGALLHKPLVWVEVWIDGSSKEDFIYLLILRKRRDGKLEIIDPQKDYSVSAVFSTYDDAAEWLREDEYEIVEGRWPEESL